MATVRVYRLIEHDDYVTLGNGSHFKRVTRELIFEGEEDKRPMPKPGDGYLVEYVD